jgi:hypothetical protein
MAAAVQGVRNSFDVILGDLGRTDEQARAAALAAGDQARLHGVGDPLPEEEVLAAIAVTPAATETVSPAMADTGEHEAVGGATPTVDELFARIRRGSDDDVAGEPLTAVVPVVAPPVVEPTVFDIEDDDEPAVKIIAVKGPDDDVIAARDAALNPIITQLSRHLKRALGDDQNRMLEILRTTPAAQGEALLGVEEAHLADYLSAAAGHIADACVAGLAFGGAPAGTAYDRAAVEQSASGLARTVVTMLRRRIDTDADSGEEAGERVSAAFREWRGERIERLVGDFAVQSFSAGVTQASGGRPLRWVLASTTGCSDCDDNALAGAVSTAEGFPTGHAFPPAHSGCRCLITPAHA